MLSTELLLILLLAGFKSKADGQFIRINIWKPVPRNSVEEESQTSGLTSAHPTSTSLETLTVQYVSEIS